MGTQVAEGVSQKCHYRYDESMLLQMLRGPGAGGYGRSGTRAAKTKTDDWS